MGVYHHTTNSLAAAGISIHDAQKTQNEIYTIQGGPKSDTV